MHQVKARKLPSLLNHKAPQLMTTGVYWGSLEARLCHWAEGEQLLHTTATHTAVQYWQTLTALMQSMHGKK